MNMLPSEWLALANGHSIDGKLRALELAKEDWLRYVRRRAMLYYQQAQELQGVKAPEGSTVSYEPEVINGVLYVYVVFRWKELRWGVTDDDYGTPTHDYKEKKILCPNDFIDEGYRKG